MHVLVDIRIERGGVGRYGRTLLEALPRVAPDIRPEAVLCEGAIQRLTRMPLTPWGRLSLTRDVSRRQPDVVHGTHLELPRASGIPCVVTIQDLIPLAHPRSMPNPLRRLAYGRTVDAALARASRVIAPSEATAGALERRGVDPTKLRVIPLGIHPIFRPMSEAEQRRARARFGAGRPYIAASVTARSHKNAQALAAAAAILRRRCDAWVVSTGAPGRGAEPLRFAGSLSDEELRHFYCGAAGLVVPSLLEGFGLPAAEALACGVPVVCGRGLGALDHIRPGVLEVDVSDPAEIAAGMQRMLEDDAYRLRLGRAGRAAAARLTVDAMASATAAVYREARASLS